MGNSDDRTKQCAGHYVVAGRGDAGRSSLLAGVGDHPPSTATPASLSVPLSAFSEAARRRIIKNAECLAHACSYADIPGRVAIVDVPQANSLAFALGSGHKLAEAFNSPAEVAVAIFVTGLFESSARGASSSGEAIGGTALDVEWCVLHELAHCLVSPLDAGSRIGGFPASLVAEYAVGKTTAGVDPRRELASHGTAWAAARAVLAQRAVAVRPESQHSFWLEGMRAEFSAYSLPSHREIAAAVADVPHDAPLRPLLSDAQWLARIPSFSIEHRLELDSRRRPKLPRRPLDDR